MEKQSQDILQKNGLSHKIAELQQQFAQVKYTQSHLISPEALAGAYECRHAICLMLHLVTQSISSWYEYEEPRCPLASVLRSVRLLRADLAEAVQDALLDFRRQEPQIDDAGYTAPLFVKLVFSADRWQAMLATLRRITQNETNAERRRFYETLDCPGLMAFLAERRRHESFDEGFLGRLFRFHTLLDDGPATGERLLGALEWLYHREGDYRVRFDQQYLAEEYLFNMAQYNWLFMGDVNITVVDGGHDHLWALAFDSDYKYTVFYQMSDFFMLNDERTDKLYFEYDRAAVTGPVGLMVMSWKVDFQRYNDIEISQLVLGGRQITGFGLQHPGALAKLSISGKIHLDLSPFVNLRALALNGDIQMDTKQLLKLQKLQYLFLDVDGPSVEVFDCLPPSLEEADLRNFGDLYVVEIATKLPCLRELRIHAEHSYQFRLNDNLCGLQSFDSEQCALVVLWQGPLPFKVIDVSSIALGGGLDKIRVECLRTSQARLDVGILDGKCAKTIYAHSFCGVNAFRGDVYADSATPSMFLAGGGWPEEQFAGMLRHRFGAAVVQCVLGAQRALRRRLLWQRAYQNQAHSMGVRLQRLIGGSQ